eukprot:PITA_14666
METVRAVLSIAAQNNWKDYQMDMKSAFLNGVLMEEVYIEQPLSYEKKGQEHKVCRLKKAFYGLKQAPRAWYSSIDSYYRKMDLKNVRENPLSISKKMMDSKATITPTVMGLKLNKEDNSKDFDPSLYKSIVGNIMYLTAARPDIMFAVSLISRFMERPKETHWQAAKRILSDCAGSVDDRKSTSGYVFHMGSRAVSWASKKQPIVALSTAETKYVAATTATCQTVSMRRMLRSLGQEQAKGTVIFCDNSSAIALSKNYVFHKRTKHIDTRFHYIRELVNNGEIVLQHCRTQEQVAEILTKPLDQKSFEFLRKCLGMTECPVVEIKGEC